MLHTVYFYNRFGLCIYYRSLNRQTKPDEGEFKLLAGLLYSLKRLVEQVSPSHGAGPSPSQGGQPVKPQQLGGQGHGSHVTTFRAYRTNTYKLHCLEVATGARIVVTSDPATADLTQLLQELYANVYVPHVALNCALTPCSSSAEDTNGAIANASVFQPIGTGGDGGLAVEGIREFRERKETKYVGAEVEEAVDVLLDASEAGTDATVAVGRGFEAALVEKLTPYLR